MYLLYFDPSDLNYRPLRRRRGFQLPRPGKPPHLDPNRTTPHHTTFCRPSQRRPRKRRKVVRRASKDARGPVRLGSWQRFVLRYAIAMCGAQRLQRRLHVDDVVMVIDRQRLSSECWLGLLWGVHVAGKYI
jgi:hypothetical protein